MLALGSAAWSPEVRCVRDPQISTAAEVVMVVGDVLVTPAAARISMWYNLGMG